MINFRYHVVSLIAVFLALAIGVIMGSAVIDRAIVDRLENQQEGLRDDIDEVEAANDQLRSENRDLRETAEQLAEEGGQRLLTGTLVDVPVLVLATRGVEDEGFEGLLSLLTASGADQRGTVWLTDRFALDDDDEVRDLAGVLDAAPETPAEELRATALTRLGSDMRREAGPAPIDDPSVPSTTSTTLGGVSSDEPSLFLALRDAGFLDFDAPDEESDPPVPILQPGTRLVLISGASSDVPVDVALAFATSLVEDRDGVPSVALLAAEDRPASEEPESEFVVALRGIDDIAGRLSTVDNIGDFAGRLASVLAIVDLGEGRVGHFGRAPGAQRLLPAPPEGG
jgi:hypothetical protein